MMYIQLFLSFFQISLFSFGGGYAALPLIQGQVVNVHHWLSMTEFTDLITISQMTPGPIAINAVVALIGSAGISILQTAFWEASGKMVISDTSWLMVGIFVVCVILLRKVKMNPIWVMVLAGVMKVLVAMAGKI